MNTPMHPTEALIRPHVAAIEASAQAGDKNAQGIIATYAMLMRAPNDPGAAGICEAYLREWLKAP